MNKLPKAGTPPLARGRGGVWTTSCLKLFPDLVRPFPGKTRAMFLRLDDTEIEHLWPEPI